MNKNHEVKYFRLRVLLTFLPARADCLLTNLIQSTVRADLDVYTSAGDFSLKLRRAL